MKLDTWRNLMQASAVTGTVAAMFFTLVMALLGLGFVPRSEFEGLRRLVRFTACVSVLDVPTCQIAHGVTIEELLKEGYRQ